MDWKNLHGYIEVSPFLLFESTADSEEDSASLDDDNMVVTHDDLDDCQSCCSDSSEIFNNYLNDHDQFQEYSYSKKADKKRLHGRDYKSSYRHQNDYDEDEDEEEDDDDGAIDQECTSRNAGFGNSRRQKKCKVYVDSKLEPMKKEENDKLFWDTCLAS